MRLTLDAAAELVPRVPALTHAAIRAAAGRKHTDARHRFLVHAVQAPFTGNRRHRQARGAVYWSAEELGAGLRVAKDARRAAALLSPLFDYPSGRRGFHAGRQTAKPFILRPDPAAAVQTVLGGDVALNAYAEAADGARTAWADLPARGAPATLAEAFPVPNVLPVPVAVVDAALATVAAWAEGEGWGAPLDPASGPAGFTLEEARRTLTGARAWCRSVGGLPNLYTLERGGRLGGVSLSVVTLPRALRALLFAGSDLADYDMQASNWRLYLSACEAAGVGTEHAAHYATYRDGYHAQWATVTGCADPKAFKAVALSWLTFGTFSTHPDAAAVQAIGADAVRRLGEWDHARRLWQEVRAGMRRLLAELLPPTTDGGRVIYVNAAGAVLEEPEDDAEQGTTEAQRAAHLLTGLEQVAMRAVGPHVRGLAAVVYDGLLAPPQDTDAWPGVVAEASRRALGFPLRVRFERKAFTPPARP